jgi:hypothetical protein
MRKASNNNGNALQFLIVDANGTLGEWGVAGAGYSMNAGEWYRITVSWSLSPNSPPEAHVYLDGVELTVTTPPTQALNLPPADATGRMFIGAFNGTVDPPWHANGVIDDFVIYSAPIVP